MKKLSLILIAFLILVCTGCGGSSTDTSSTEEKEEQTQEQTVETEEKEEDYSALSTEELISRARNIRQQLEGKLDSEYMTPEEKVTEADRVSALAQEYADAIEPRKDDSTADLDTWQAFGAIRAMANDLKDYAQTGSQEDHDKFLEQNETVKKFTDLAQEQLNK